MKTQSQHTPTPWETYTGDGGTEHIAHEVDSHTLSIAEITQGMFAEQSKEVRKTNAAFIVRAVNCHDEFLTAIKEALCWLDPDCKLDGENKTEDKSDRENMIIALYEVLEKAGK